MAHDHHHDHSDYNWAFAIGVALNVGFIIIETVFGLLAGLSGAESVHDLHIWAMSTTESALTAYLVKPDSIDDDALIEKASKELHDRFGGDQRLIPSTNLAMTQ
jgi:Co/Zn/Cd efflux system component